MKIKTLLLGILIVCTNTHLVAQENITVNNDNCTCQKNDPIKYNYLPKFHRVVDYKMFSKLIDWKLAGGEETFILRKRDLKLNLTKEKQRCILKKPFYKIYHFLAIILFIAEKCSIFAAVIIEAKE